MAEKDLTEEENQIVFGFQFKEITPKDRKIKPPLEEVTNLVLEIFEGEIIEGTLRGYISKMYSEDGLDRRYSVKRDY